jgi:hypothetical protein
MYQLLTFIQANLHHCIELSTDNPLMLSKSDDRMLREVSNRVDNKVRKAQEAAAVRSAQKTTSV